MGDPRTLRKKFTKPSHPWQKLRIEEEKELMKSYGFKNKKELWRLNSQLRNFKLLVKELVPRKDEQGETQKKMLLAKLLSLNLVKSDAILEDILSLTLQDMCERRLQTLVWKKGLASSIKQARQFVTHGHIAIGGKKLTSPSYLITAKEEGLIGFAENSPLISEDHPERAKAKAQPEVVAEEPKTEQAEKNEN